MKSSLKLFDTIHKNAGSNPATEATDCLVQHLVETALREILDLRQLDERLAPLVEPDERIARAMRNAYRQAAEHARAVIDRVERMSISYDLPQFERLQDGHCRLEAMFSVKPEDVAAAKRELREGKVHTVAELRDELYARLHG